MPATEQSMALAHRVRILNGTFDPLTLTGTVDAIFRLIDEGRRGWLCTVNVSILMMMRSNPRLQRFADEAAIVVADGQPLIWCGAWLGGRLPERVAGVDLVEALCQKAAREGKRVYLLGATDDIVRKLAERLKSQYADLMIDCSDGYFSHAEATARAEQIRKFGTDILFVGMGVPRQEYFLDEQWERLGVPMAIGVGGSFDVLSGTRMRAPGWMQSIGMEWFFRLIQEPRRLFMRYLITNSQFIYLVAIALLKRRTAP